MNGVSWNHHKVLYSDGDNAVRLITQDEPSSSEIGYATLQRTLSVLKSNLSIWDVQSSPVLPFVASACTSVRISNTNRTLRFQKPCQVTLYSLSPLPPDSPSTQTKKELGNDEGDAGWICMKDTRSQPGHPLSVCQKGQTGLSSPALTVQRVTWNGSGRGERAFWVASGGRMGFVRIESVRRLKG